MKAYLISLKRRPDKLAASLTELATTNFQVEVFEAVDGDTVRKPRTFKQTSGANGCRLSHVNVLYRCLADGVKEAAVFEDDVKFVPDFAQKFEAFMSVVPDDWDAILLGGQHDRRTPPKRINDLVAKINGAHRTHSYLVRGDYRNALIRLWENANTHIDAVWQKNQRHANVFCPWPNWLTGQRGGRSDITGRRNPDQFWNFQEVRKVTVTRRKA